MSLGRVDRSTEAASDKVSGIAEPSDKPQREIAASDPEPAANAIGNRSDEELIDDPDCRFRAGRGPASDTGLFVLPGTDEGRFLARDQTGTLFGDDLPFDPSSYSIGKRADGDVLAVLGDMRVHSRESQARQFHGHARVYWNGQIVYENEKLWDYGVASNGSSFYVIEPLAGGTSRLVLHNLDEREEHHFDLGRRMTHFDNHGRPYGVHYSSSMSEVVLSPGQELNDSPRGQYWFYANDGSGPRVIRIRSVDLPPRTDDALSEVDRRQVRDEPILRGGVMPVASRSCAFRVKRVGVLPGRPQPGRGRDVRGPKDRVSRLW